MIFLDRLRHTKHKNHRSRLGERRNSRFCTKNLWLCPQPATWRNGTGSEELDRSRGTIHRRSLRKTWRAQGRGSRNRCQWPTTRSRRSRPGGPGGPSCQVVERHNDERPVRSNHRSIRRPCRVISLVGNTMRTGYTAPKILWLRQNEPENWKRTRSILLPHDYLNFWLTGAKKMEFGDASGTALLDVKARQWTIHAENKPTLFGATWLDTAARIRIGFMQVLYGPCQTCSLSMTSPIRRTRATSK